MPTAVGVVHGLMRTAIWAVRPILRGVTDGLDVGLGQEFGTFEEAPLQFTVFVFLLEGLNGLDDCRHRPLIRDEALGAGEAGSSSDQRCCRHSMARRIKVLFGPLQTHLLVQTDSADQSCSYDGTDLVSRTGISS